MLGNKKIYLRFASVDTSEINQNTIHNCQSNHMRKNVKLLKLSLGCFKHIASIGLEFVYATLYEILVVKDPDLAEI